MSRRLTVGEALDNSGVCEPVEDGYDFNFERMEAIARLLAAEPDISKMGISKRLGISRPTVIRYVNRLKAAMSEGRLDLSLCIEESEAEAVVEYVGDEYSPAESIEATLRLIRGQKKKLERKQRSGKAVSTSQILQLVNAEKAALAIPQRAEEVPKDFYDQLFGRVPVPDVGCPHCGTVIKGGERYDSVARRDRDFEELGRAGDLVPDGAEGEKEAINA